MKIRSLWTVAIVLAVAFSLALASNDGEKTKKAAPAKKEMKSCCSGETKSASGCTDLEMKETGAKEAHGAKKSDEAKVEKKSSVSEPEKK